VKGLALRRLENDPMLKSDLIAILVQKRGVTQKQAESTIETIFESMKDALCEGENIEIRGLGAFHVKHYNGYQGRNPKTGQVIPVKPKRGILFRTGKELRDRVNRAVQSPAEARPAAAEPVAAAPAVPGTPGKEPGPGATG
jgi:integration host factor subunit beta